MSTTADDPTMHPEGSLIEATAAEEAAGLADESQFRVWLVSAVKACVSYPLYPTLFDEAAEYVFGTP